MLRKGLTVLFLFSLLFAAPAVLAHGPEEDLDPDHHGEEPVTAQRRTSGTNPAVVGGALVVVGLGTAAWFIFKKK